MCVFLIYHQLCVSGALLFQKKSIRSSFRFFVAIHSGFLWQLIPVFCGSAPRLPYGLGRGCPMSSRE